MALISFYLFPPTVDIISKKEEHENAQWGRDLLMSSASVSHNALGPPVNLWTPATIGQHFLLRVHSVKFASVMSPVSLHSEPKCRVLMNVHQSPVPISVP